jgi:hypothetical protein
MPLPVSPGFIRLVPRPDRRDQSARQRLLARVRAEFHQSSARMLTPSEAAGRIGVSQDICARLLDELVDDGFLSRDAAAYAVRH